MATALLLAALVLPVALYWLLRSRSRASGMTAAVIAVALGWALNLVWALAAHESTAVAAAFGWLCPTVLVFLTWFVWRIKARNAARDPS